MNSNEKDHVKVQEWVVRFNGKINQSEKLIDSEEYHKKLKDKLKEKE